MPDPAMPPDLAARLRDIETRLSKLERLPRLPSSSTRGGSLRLLDDAGTTRWAAGNVLFDGSIGDSTTGYGVFEFDDQGAMIRAQATGYRGQIYPAMPFPMHDPTPKAVTSPTFTGVFEARIQFPIHEVLSVQVAVQTDADTTGEVRLSTLGAAHTTAALPLPAATNSFAVFEWLHPAMCGLFDPRSGREVNLQVSLDLRRTGGTGQVRAFAPIVSELTSLWFIPTASATGNPRLT